VRVAFRHAVLDGMNILKHSKDGAPWHGGLEWGKLFAAARYYQELNLEVSVFLPRYQFAHSAKERRILERHLGPESVVICPAGADDDDFMINFAKQGEGRCIVTNGLSRYHGLEPEWVSQFTVKFTFARGEFLPQG
jgi:hypothetical protein